MHARIEEIDATHEAHIYEANLDDIRAVADHCQTLQNAGMTGDRDMWALMTVPAIIV